VAPDKGSGGGLGYWIRVKMHLGPHVGFGGLMTNN
jgi:hypothetical protein